MWSISCLLCVMLHRDLLELTNVATTSVISQATKFLRESKLLPYPNESFPGHVPLIDLQ
jgi:hypothetical protein